MILEGGRDCLFGFDGVVSAASAAFRGGFRGCARADGGGEWWEFVFEDAFDAGPESEGFDDHPDFEGECGDADDDDGEVTGCGVAGCSGGVKPGGELGEHGPGGHDEHEDHGDGYEVDGGFASPEVEGDDEEGEACEELVGGAEEWPENEAACAGGGHVPGRAGFG